MPSAADPDPHRPIPPVRVLVADDDEISCRFLAAGLRSLGAEVETCGHGTRALALARTRTFDLLILDCRMPGAGALEIATALRGDADPPVAAIVASSAAFTADARTALTAAGCAATLDKPCTLAELRQILALAIQGGPVPGVLDDAAGYRSAGDAATLAALRDLLRGELAALHGELDGLAARPVELSARLHRLRAACGFCGASRLADAARLLQAELSTGAAPGGPALDRFRGVMTTTRHALDACGSPP